MGNPNFAISSLEIILQKSRHHVLAVISNPPKPMGRKKILKHTEVGSYAIKNNLELIELGSFDDDDIYKKIVSLDIDVFVVVAFRILPEKYISIPRFGSINLHASLLPQYRGAAPIQWALMNGDNVTGVSIFQIEKKVDTGGIIHLEKIKIQNQKCTRRVQLENENTKLISILILENICFNQNHLRRRWRCFADDDPRYHCCCRCC